jgi:hypothetical protein
LRARGKAPRLGHRRRGRSDPIDEPDSAHMTGSNQPARGRITQHRRGVLIGPFPLRYGAGAAARTLFYGREIQTLKLRLSAAFRADRGPKLPPKKGKAPTFALREGSVSHRWAHTAWRREREAGPVPCLPKGSITKEARLVAVSPHASTLASEPLSNFPEVMLHPASLPGRSVRYALADLVLLMPKPPTMLTTFVLLAPAWSTLRAPLPVWPTLYRDHVRHGDRSGTARDRAGPPVPMRPRPGPVQTLGSTRAFMSPRENLRGIVG